MKRFSRLIATLIASSFVLPLVAGNNDAAQTQNADRAMFGVRAVCDITNSRTVSEITDWGAGGAAGISFYIPFGKLTYFSPALLIGCETVKLDGVAGTEEKPYYFDGNIKNDWDAVSLGIWYKAISFTQYHGQCLHRSTYFY